MSTIQRTVPVVLHCASLSVAGTVLPSEQTISALNGEADRTQTLPWIGEHLAFISADGIDEYGGVGGEPANLGFTLLPQLSFETIERVANNLEKPERVFARR